MKRKSDAIDRLYDSFVVKDLSRKEFRRQYCALTDPVGIRKDLRRAVMDRRVVQTTNVLAGEKKQEIEKAMKYAE